jgi:phosphatidylserine decarboxylase
MIAWIAGALGSALIVGFAWWRFHYFHRNPSRVVPAGFDPVSPADGRIVYVEPVVFPDRSNEYHRRIASAFGVDGRWSVIATYLGIFDVHFVRAPVAGTVRLRRIDPIGGNASMGRSFFYSALRRPLPVGERGYLDKNEFVGVDISGDERILVVLMADWWIDQITTFVTDGARVERGQVIGRILMGSQVDLWVREGRIVPRLAAGHRVYAGETVIANRVTSGRPASV